jgi:hypothetical protein
MATQTATEQGCIVAAESGKSITIQWEDGERVCYSVDDDALDPLRLLSCGDPLKRDISLLLFSFHQ